MQNVNANTSRIRETKKDNNKQVNNKTNKQKQKGMKKKYPIQFFIVLSAYSSDIGGILAELSLESTDLRSLSIWNINITVLIR